MTPDYWDDAKTRLSRRDKTLAKIIRAYKGETLALRGDAFYTLARAIAGQQISVKAADSVWRKLETSLRKVTPATLGKATTADLRACGLSAQKIVYLQGLAAHFAENKRHVKRWPELADDELIGELTVLKGIGRWTAEMFLIFSLGRPDVFPVADIGLQKAIFRHYNKEQKMALAELAAFGERWRPYRTVATWYLWRALDPVPVEY